MVRLAFGVVAGRDLGVWAPGLDGVPMDATRAAPGAAVVVGPRSATEPAVAAAISGLADLIEAGGIMAAGAGVAVGHRGSGFHTARLGGADGDRRDAVLAVLRTLGVDGAERLGDRAGMLTALFGPDVTKRVGSAAAAAVHDGRWGAVHLASAASDLLGPEQLEQILALTGPHDQEADGLASELAVPLTRVLGSLTGPRRLAVLLDLWHEVGQSREQEARYRRRREARNQDDRTAELRERYLHLVEEWVVRMSVFDAPEPRRLYQLRWTPPKWAWVAWLKRMMHDAVAATVLARAALAVIDHGPRDGIAAARAQLATAPYLIDPHAAATARTRVPGLAPFPARPGVLVREIDDRLQGAAEIDDAVVAYVRQRLARARDYAAVMLGAAEELVTSYQVAAPPLGIEWSCEHLRQWREVIGYGRDPRGWEQPVLGHDGPTLAQRLRDQPGAAPSDVEQAGDLLWYAELADAVAQLDGYPAAMVTYAAHAPAVRPVPAPEAEPEPLLPPINDVASAVRAAARLVDLGAGVPAKVRTWRELVDALMVSAVIAESVDRPFAVPPGVLARDGATIPGTDLRVEVARHPHQLVAWSTYMGNCISGQYYQDTARTGRRVLAALRGPDGRMVANVDLQPGAHGCRLNEIEARFNVDPDPALASQVQAWAASVAPVARPVPRPPVRVVRQPRRVVAVDRHRRRRTRDWIDLMSTVESFAAEEVGADHLDEAIRPLALDGRDLDATVCAALARGQADLLALWRATDADPLTTALGRLDPELRRRHGFLELLLADGPLPRRAIELARVPAIAEARRIERLAHGIRAMIGRLARAADPVLSPLVVRDADPNLLCALVLAVSTAATAPPDHLAALTRRGDTAVPGHPPTALDDEAGPWRRSSADALALGARLYWHLPAPALYVPRTWLGRGGWTRLWSRVHGRQSTSD